MNRIYNVFKQFMIIVCLMMLLEDYILMLSNRIQWVIILIATMIVGVVIKIIDQNDNV